MLLKEAGGVVADMNHYNAQEAEELRQIDEEVSVAVSSTTVVMSSTVMFFDPPGSKALQQQRLNVHNQRQIHRQQAREQNQHPIRHITPIIQQDISKRSDTIDVKREAIDQKKQAF